MDFELDAEPAALRELAWRIFSDLASPQRVAEVEAGPGVDDALWKELARAGITGITAPEESGGADLGSAAVCAVLEQQGEHVAPVPLWTHLVAVLTLARSVDPGRVADALAGAADGQQRIALALEEHAPADLQAPSCTASSNADGWRLTGNKAAVPALDGSSQVVVSAAEDGGPALFLVDPDADGVFRETAATTSRDRSGHLSLQDAPALRLGGTDLFTRTLDAARAALAGLQLGTARGALRHAGQYLAEREQFGRPLATFQAVSHQLADCYIDIECMAVTAWEAAWTADSDEPDRLSAAVARWWAAEAGQRVVYRVQHLHGGIGVDIDYPVHRYFLWGKEIAGMLQPASAELEHIGRELADGGGA